MVSSPIPLAALLRMKSSMAVLIVSAQIAKAAPPVRLLSPPSRDFRSVDRD
jgi:hypothetical protein